jgi:sodium pump decarboxylase gamma subunit
LYITAVGMGGVFTILSLLALFMYLMGRVDRRNMEVKIEQTEMEIINRNEEIAIISAALAYHVEGEADVVPLIGSDSWKKFAREYSLRR